MPRIAPETLERLRGLPAAQVYETVRSLAYQTAGGSEEYLELMEEMVTAGLLTFEEIEAFEGARDR